MPYRLEKSRSNQAGCKTCGGKIKKDELRSGTLIKAKRYGSWVWRHWGCTTPLVIKHMTNEIFHMNKLTGHEDFGRIDGWENLGEYYQATVQCAFVQGHVSDDEWKGDPELNRPGKKGFRPRSLGKNTKVAETMEVERSRADSPDYPSKPLAKATKPTENQRKGPKGKNSDTIGSGLGSRKLTKQTKKATATIVSPQALSQRLQELSEGIQEVAQKLERVM